jgi:hypothetical protein
VIAAAPAGRGKRKARRAPNEAEAALRAFQVSVSSAESNDDEGYGDLIKKRAEAQSAVQGGQLADIKTATSPGVFGVFVGCVSSPSRPIKGFLPQPSMIL